MYNHVLEEYTCPFCLLVSGIENEHVYSKQADIVWKDEQVTAFISSNWWPNNPGHILIIPNEHFEHLYDISDEVLVRIHVLSKRIAIGFKELRKCDGVSTKQHNEPHGYQEVFHYHLHVYPRYEGDDLYRLKKGGLAPEKEWWRYAKEMREWLEKNMYSTAMQNER